LNGNLDIVGLAQVSELDEEEVLDVVDFSNDAWDPSLVMNAIYIRSDIDFLSDSCQIATLRDHKRFLEAVLLRMESYYVPLGQEEQALELMKQQMNLREYFVRIPQSWEQGFIDWFEYDDSIRNEIFVLGDPDSFQPIPAPRELEVRIAATPEETTELAKYYGKDPEEMKRTAGPLPRVFGRVGQEIVSVAKTNAVTETFAILGGVHTLPEFRGRGYSKAVVSTWTQEVLRRRLEPILDTYVHNRPALAVYEAVGYKRHGRVTYFSNGLSIIDELRTEG